ncbi:MAG TPA: YcgL domain-containing protein [Anaerolineae bacterium]|nr:YcgL domain-containing protein [Anaerolineae bacterium]
MKCYIYRSRKQDEMYLYLRERDDFSAVPAELMRYFVNPVFVFELELTPARQLARADVTQVMANLREHGYHLQPQPPREALG